MGLVKLYDGPAPFTCNCGNWREHFNKFSTQWVIWCAETTCERIALNGALVQVYKSRNAEIFVVPLCNFHTRTTKLIDIGEVDPVNIMQDICKQHKA